MVGQEVQSALDAAQHPQGEDVDFHEFERVDVVLVPLDDLAVVYGGRLDRDQLIEPVMGQHEAAGMLREVARRAHELAGEIEGQPAV